jgi:hypothetical protein
MAQSGTGGRSSSSRTFTSPLGPAGGAARYSITAVACSIIDGGTARPSAFAVATLQLVRSPAGGGGPIASHDFDSGPDDQTIGIVHFAIRIPVRTKRRPETTYRPSLARPLAPARRECPASEPADPPHAVALLRARRERPCRSAAEERAELAPPNHSITSSARSRIDGGTVGRRLVGMWGFRPSGNPQAFNGDHLVDLPFEPLN